MIKFSIIQSNSSGLQIATANDFETAKKLADNLAATSQAHFTVCELVERYTTVPTRKD